MIGHIAAMLATLALVMAGACLCVNSLRRVGFKMLMVGIVISAAAGVLR